MLHMQLNGINSSPAPVSLEHVARFDIPLLGCDFAYYIYILYTLADLAEVLVAAVFENPRADSLD